MPIVVILFALALSLAGCITESTVPTAIASNAERGAQLFTQGQENTPPCSTCHHIVTGQLGFSIGPNLAKVVERAGTRVVGMTAAEYLRQSILEPRAYVVSGYRDIMFPDYRTHLTEQNIQDLIAYLLIL